MAHARKTLTPIRRRARAVGCAGMAHGAGDLYRPPGHGHADRPDLSGSRRIAGGPGGDTWGSQAALQRCWPRGCRQAALGPSWRPSPPPSTPIRACGPAWRCIGSGARRPRRTGCLGARCVDAPQARRRACPSSARAQGTARASVTLSPLKGAMAFLDTGETRTYAMLQQVLRNHATLHTLSFPHTHGHLWRARRPPLCPDGRPRRRPGHRGDPVADRPQTGDPGAGDPPPAPRLSGCAPDPRRPWGISPRVKPSSPRWPSSATTAWRPSGSPRRGPSASCSACWRISGDAPPSVCPHGRRGRGADRPAPRSAAGADHGLSPPAGSRLVPGLTKVLCKGVFLWHVLGHETTSVCSSSDR